MNRQSASAILWIEKLLTAKADGIKQGRGRLGNLEDGFCCLGYGCELSKIAYEHNEEFSDALKEKVGLLHGEGRTANNNKSLMLIFLNDDRGWGFARIANRLKKYPHLYFIPKVAQVIKEHFAKEQAIVNEPFDGWQPEIVIIKRKDGKPISNWETNNE